MGGAVSQDLKGEGAIVQFAPRSAGGNMDLYFVIDTLGKRIFGYENTRIT